MHHQRQVCGFRQQLGDFAGVMPHTPTITPLARILMQKIRLIVRRSISSDTRLQATRPIEAMLRNALIVSAWGSITYSRNTWKFVSPAVPEMRVQVAPARRHTRPGAIHDPRAGRGRGDDAAVIADMDRPGRHGQRDGGKVRQCQGHGSKLPGEAWVKGIAQPVADKLQG